MKKVNHIVIKPLKDQYITWIIIFYLIFLIIFIVGVIVSIFLKENIPWIGIGITLCIYSGLITVISLISRFLYKDKLIITKDEIIKLHKNQVQFHIAREKLLLIGVRRVKPYVKLLTIFGTFIGDICTDLISFRFIEADISEVRKFWGVLEMTSLTEEEKKEGIKEFVESVTYRQALQISKLLNVPIINVKF